MKLIAAACAFALLALGVGPAPAADTGRITLRGVTTIDAGRSGWVPVRLPRDVDNMKDLKVSFGGDGRIIAFVMTKEAGKYPLGEGPTLIGWSFGRCEEKGCAAKGFLISYTVATGPLKEKDGRFYLPAGNYRIYFVQDGAAASLRFDFEDLTGKTDLPLPNRLTKRVKTLVPRSDVDGQENVYWGGRATKVDGPGASILGMWVEGGDNATTGEAGFCIYDEAPADPDTAYVPPCPTADDPVAQQMRAKNNEFSYFNHREIDKGLGAHYTTPVEVTRAGGVAFWLKY